MVLFYKVRKLLWKCDDMLNHALALINKNNASYWKPFTFGVDRDSSFLRVGDLVLVELMNDMIDYIAISCGSGYSNSITPKGEKRLFKVIKKEGNFVKLQRKNDFFFLDGLEWVDKNHAMIPARSLCYNELHFLLYVRNK